jgi:hypothetical protein
MRYGRRDEWDDNVKAFLLVAFLVVLVGLFAWWVVDSVQERRAWREECYGRGGEPFCPYKSRCVCLKPGAVIQ